MPEELHIVTEVGVFGDLDIKDPTAKQIKRNTENLSEAEMQTIINEAMQANANIKI